MQNQSSIRVINVISDKWSMVNIRNREREMNRKARKKGEIIYGAINHLEKNQKRFAKPAGDFHFECAETKAK